MQILHRSSEADSARHTAFVVNCATSKVPTSWAHRIALFRETGRVFRRNDELFAENSWVQVMMGQGIMPESHHPITARLSDEELDRLLTTLRQNIATTVRGLPPHADYVARHCGTAA